MRKARNLKIILAVVALSGASTGLAGENHYTPGMYGTRDFFLPADPGFYFADLNSNYVAGEFFTGSGKKLNSLTIERSLERTGTFDGSRSFSLTKTRSSSFNLQYAGSSLDLAAQIDSLSTATLNLTLQAQLAAELKAQTTLNARLKDLDLRSTCFAPTLVWASKSKVLGARFGIEVCLPIVDMSIDAKVEGRVSSRVQLKGQLTASALANLSVNSTATGAISINNSRGNGIGATGSKNISAGKTASASVVKKVGTELRVHRDFSLDVKASTTALSDLFVQPLWLDWSGDHYEISLSDAFYAPTGKYSAGALDNTGLGFWTNQCQLAAAWYPWKDRGTAVTVAGTYEINGKQRGVDITPGQYFTVNWGVSQYLPLNKAQTWLADVGVGGYDIWQVTADSGSGVTYDAGVRDQLHAYGVQLGLAQTKWNAALTMRWMHEYGARDRFQGDMYVLNVAVKF